jgi:hypothetical protein
MEVSPERLFFMYAFPALASCTNASADKIGELEELLISGGSPTQSELEGMFPLAFERITRMSYKDDHLNTWAFDTIKKYWWEEHNRIIDSGEDGYEDSPRHAKEACKVSFVEVVDFQDNKIVYYGKGGEDKTASTYFKDLKVGDFVTIHLGRVVEKISGKDFEKYRE